MYEIPMKGIGIGDSTLNLYLRQKLNCNRVVILVDNEYRDNNAICLQQKDYGGDNDCTLTSITAFVNESVGKDNQEVYNVVEKIATRYGYTGSRGTNPLFVKPITEKAFETFGQSVSMKNSYLKGLCISYPKIQELIDNGKYPIILNLLDDGRDYYHDHTIMVVGYRNLLVLNKDNNTENSVQLLEVYDNWYKGIRYVDFDFLSVICSINYRRV